LEIGVNNIHYQYDNILID